MPVSFAPEGRYLLSKSGGAYRLVVVCPHVCKIYTLKRKEQEYNCEKWGISRQEVVPRTEREQNIHVSSNWYVRLFNKNFFGGT